MHWNKMKLKTGRMMRRQEQQQQTFPIVVLLLVFNIFLVTRVSGEPLMYLGCYFKDSSSTGNSGTTKVETSISGGARAGSGAGSNSVLDLWFTPRSSTSSEDPPNCVLACKSDSFRYAGVTVENGYLSCLCGGSYGMYGIGQCNNCTDNQHHGCGSINSFSVYDTGFKVPSSPQQVLLLQRNENSLRISWIKPIATNGPLVGYQVNCTGLFSYSHNPLALQSKILRTKTDLEQEIYLPGLYPGTEYNIEVSAINSEGQSLPTTVQIWTKVGVPDNPPQPEILSLSDDRMTIKFDVVRNTKGPISSYRIAMIDDTIPGLFSKDRVSTWEESKRIGYPQYITAEFLPDEVPWSGRKFTIGDGNTYGSFYNGPIPKGGHWHPSLGIVSSMDGFTEITYSSTSHDQHSGISNHKSSNSKVEPLSNPKLGVTITSPTPPIVIALWSSIGICSLVLLLCIGAYLTMKYKLLPKRRQRPTPNPPVRRQENHQLTQRSEPMSPYLFPDEPGGYIHSGFVQDEDLKGRCLDKLKEVWYIPRNFMDIPEDSQETEIIKKLGKGKFGYVWLSSLQDSSPVLLYSISDSYFTDAVSKNNTLQEDPEKLLRNIEDLVRLKSHENIIKLIGFLEDQATIYFTFEYIGTSLKSWLLDYRKFGESTKSEVSPYSFLLCGMNIAEALYHLESYNITHGQLSASNVLVANNIEVPKITGFGLLSYDSPKEERDYTRWGAVELFQNRCVKPSDAWSFGIVLHEIASLGGTPYHDIKTEDLKYRISRGARLKQLESIGDGLYQVMLNCWQLDRDERPDFGTLSCSIHELLSNSKENLFISPSVNYPPYIHKYEHI